MRPFFKQVIIQFKLDIRNKNVLLPYYIIPFIFFMVMSAVFDSIIPNYNEVLIPSMIVFSITMASILGLPVSVFEVYGTDIKRMFYLGNIPHYVPFSVSLISSFIHFSLLSISIIIVGTLLYSATIPINSFLFVIALICFILASEGIGIFIGVLAKKQSTIALFGQAIFLPSVILSGSMFDATLLPEILQYFSYILPASLAMKAMNQGDFYWLMNSLLLAIFIISCTVVFYRTRKIAY